MTTKTIQKEAILSDPELSFLLKKQSKKYSLVTTNCSFSCADKKINIANYTINYINKKPAITSSIETFKSKRKLNKFWGLSTI